MRLQVQRPLRQGHAPQGQETPLHVQGNISRHRRIHIPTCRVASGPKYPGPGPAVNAFETPTNRQKMSLIWTLFS